MSMDPSTTPNDVSCGHYDQFQKNRFNRLFSRVAAIRAAGNGEDSAYPDVFEYTHRPITVFAQSTDDSTSTPKPVDEDDILDEFDPSAIGNFSVVIEGPVGTGKSELCAYLTHKLRNERDRPVLRVDKDSDLLTMLSETIPEFYERETGETLERSGDLRELATGLEENPDIVAGLVVSKGLDILRKDFDIDTQGNKDDLEEFILDRLNELVERRHQGEDAIEDEREGFRFVTKQDYKSGHTEALHVFDGATGDNKPWELLNNKFWSALLEEFDSPPLNDLLVEVGQAFDTRPVCVFEDFSIAAVQAEKLRNYMERDNDKDNWDFIVAGTTDYTQTLHTQTSEDRFRFYQTNKPESKQVEFLSEDSVVDFIRPYLAYPKTSDESLQYSDNGSNGKTLQDSPNKTVCGECGICANEFRDLFPFNETFIERIYNPGLDEDDRRPRSIVTIIKDILEEVYYGPTNVPSSAQALEEINPPDVYVTDEVLKESNTIADLAIWYGTETTHNDSTYYEVSRAFTDAFDVDGIPTREEQQQGEVGAGIEFMSDAIYVPAAAEIGSGGTEVDRGGEDDDGGDDDDGENGGSQVGPEPYSRLRKNVAAWVKDPTSEDYAETRKYMNSGLKSLFKYLTDGYSLWAGTGLGFYIGKKKPFVFKKSSNAPERHQIVLDLDQFQRSTLRSLLKFGIEQEELTAHSARSPEDFLEGENQGTHFSRLAEQWQSKLVSTYITSDDILYKKAAQRRNYDFDDFVVATYAWIVMLDDPWCEISAESLNERYQDSNDFSIDPRLEEGLSDLPNDTQATFEEAMEITPYIEDILGSRLGITQNALDVPTVREHLQRHTPYDVFDNLAKNPYINNINRDVRFNSDTEAKLQEMALRMYNLQRKIDDDVINMQRSVDEANILNQLRGLSITDVEDIHKTLTQSYAAQMPSELKEALDGFVSDIDQETIDQVVDGAELIQHLGTTNQERVHQCLAELKLQEHSVEDYLDTLGNNESGETTDSFATTFLEVSQYYE